MEKWKVRRHQTRQAWVVDPPGHDRTNRNVEWQAKGGKTFHHGNSIRGQGKTSAKARKEAFAHARAQAHKVTVTVPERPQVLDLAGWEAGRGFTDRRFVIRSFYGEEIRLHIDNLKPAAGDLLLFAERNKI